MTKGGKLQQRGVVAAWLVAPFALTLTGTAFAQVQSTPSEAVAFSRTMSPGWNLGNALEAMGPNGAKFKTSQETAWGNPEITPELLKAIRAAGFRSIRIPVAWNQYADANNQISDAWMKRVEEVVGYARKADLTVIINTHWDGGWAQPTNAARDVANAKLKVFWTQIATRFRDADDRLLFAGTNEVTVKDVYTAPTAENCAVQNGFNQIFVDTVRATGGNNTSRYLVVQGYNTNIDYTLSCNATLPRDPTAGRMMMEVHFYDPYNFTLNAQSKIWQWGVIATDKAATEPWAHEAHVDQAFGKMKAQFIDRGVPVILGEYSATAKTEYDPSGKYRLYWNAYVTRAAHKRGIVPYYWDSGYVANHQSGLFDRKRAKPAVPDIISTIVDMTK